VAVLVVGGTALTVVGAANAVVVRPDLDARVVDVGGRAVVEGADGTAVDAATVDATTADPDTLDADTVDATTVDVGTSVVDAFGLAAPCFSTASQIAAVRGNRAISLSFGPFATSRCAASAAVNRTGPAGYNTVSFPLAPASSARSSSVSVIGA
jgi:hypothetical protein